jgi:hypothetical protein
MKTYFKSSEKFETALNRFKIYGYSVERKKVTCACGESAGAYIFDDKSNKSIKTAKVVVKCECCYNGATIAERGE